MIPEQTNLEEAGKPNAPYSQSSESDIVEDRISGQRDGDPSIGSQETYQCSLKDIIPVEVTTNIGESAPVETDILINNEEEAREVVIFTSWLMTEQKGELSLSNLDTAIYLFRQILDGRSQTHPPYANASRDLASALGVRFIHTNQLNDILECLSLRLDRSHMAVDQEEENINNISPLHLEDEEEIATILELANGLFTDFKLSPSPVVLNTIIILVQQALPHLVSAHGMRLMALTTLVDGLHARQHLFNDVATGDLNQAISEMEDAINCCTDWDQECQLGLRIAALSMERYDITDTISDLHSGLFHLQTCSKKQGTVIRNLQYASELAQRFTRTASLDDLNTAIRIFHEIMAKISPENENYTASMNNLANALNIRFTQSAQHSDLDEAIHLHRQLVELRRPPHPHRSMSLNNLALALQTRFEQGGRHSDLDEAIPLYRQALELQPPPHPERSNSLNNLASILCIRFRQGGQHSDLNEAISLQEEALQLRPHPHPHRSMSLNNLAVALQSRFDQKGQHSDLGKAISLHRQALELRPWPHSDRLSSLNNLASALSTRFTQNGQSRDQDEAISLYREALELRPPPHPDRPGCLINLASSLTTRSEWGGQNGGDLAEAISLQRQAVELMPGSHPGRSMSLVNLANALSILFDWTGQDVMLDEAISLYRQALELQTQSHSDRSIYLSNLATTLEVRSRQIGQDNDLDEAICLHRQALELHPPPHCDRPASLNNLANALSIRSKRGGRMNDLDEAVFLHKQAVESLPPHHLDRSGFLNNMARVLKLRFEQGGQRSDLDEAMLLLSTATQHRFQPPSRCLHISRQWIRFATAHQHHSLITAYNAALQILPRVAALSLTLDLRQKALISGSDGLARDASRCAILLRDFAKAVEFLEAGRTVFWSQVLSLRSPFDQLRDILPDGPILADSLQRISRELEHGSHRQVLARILDNHAKLSIDRESSRLNRLAEEWDETVLKVRTLPSFEDFLLPPRLSSLQPAATKHPVVLLITNDGESHCLVLTSAAICHIPLPSLHSPILKVLVENVRMASSPSMSRSLIDESRHIITQMLGKERGISYQHRSEESDGIFRFVLELLWDDVVRPIIGCLNIKKHSDKPFILQWCPTGHFTFLPLHAAGIYDAENSATNCAADYFISSYTPTIGILLAEPSSIPSQTFKMMTVIQSQELPSTKSELEKIRTHVPKDALIEIGVAESPAYVETVASRLSEVSIVHFACHGHQDPTNPLNSGLKLDGGGLQISRIMKEKMPNGALAFLSACETAMGDEDLPDEAMSLAASLLFCGFRRVVATLWMMSDADGPVIADAFYRELFRGADGEKMYVPDVTKSAYALHVAVKELRSQKVSFRRWVPFIHMGQC